MNRRKLFSGGLCVWLCSLQAYACSDDEPADGGAGGGGTSASLTGSNTSMSSTSSATSVSSTNSTSGMGGDGGMGGHGGGGTCTPDKACFEVVPVQGQTASGEIAVLWFQLYDNGPDPAPLIAYQAPFDGSATEVEILLSKVAIPNPENLLCDRACDDESMCPCLDDAQAGLAVVIVASSQALAAPVFDYDDLYGIARMGMGYSAVDQVPPPAYLTFKFPDGLLQGVRPYRLIDDGMFDNLGLTQGNEVFELFVCPTAAACDLPNPNFT